MKRATQCGLVLVALASAAIDSRADAVGDYKVILERNPFGLKPPPPPAPPPTNAPPEAPTLFKLTGVSALFSPPRAMFVNVSNPNKHEYFDVTEGERGKGLTVLTNGIDFAAGTVRVQIDGQAERIMSFDKDGMKPAPGSPLMTAPGGAVQPFRFNPAQAAPSGTVPSTLQPNVTAVPFGTGAPAGFPTASTSAAIPAPAVVPATGTPPRQVRGIPINPSPQPQSQLPPAPDVDPAKQQVQMLLNEKLNPGAPPMPPTDLKAMLQQSPQLPPLPARP